MSTPTATSQYQQQYEEARLRGLDLDMTRGKPCADQLDLSAPLLAGVGAEYLARDGTDCRNYGCADGLADVKRLYASYLGVGIDEILMGDNSSLSLMHDVVAQALLRGVPGSDGPWAGTGARFLCPVPGYDRHFSICEHLGIEMVTVPLGSEGPDLETVARLAGEDERIKGIFCVPRYSNPTGITYSDATVRGLASMETAAKDFRIIWDNAYAVHHLYPNPAPLTNILDECKRAGNSQRPLLFGSTSKITLAGAGLAMVGASEVNLADLRLFRSKQSIGPDKLSELSHLRFLPDLAAIENHMQNHADILRPKFEAVLMILDERLGPHGVATWTRPRGGYFISLETREGCASEVIDLAAQAGVRLTPAGATFPYGRDPKDTNIRLAPSYPSIEELREATGILALSILIVSEQKGFL